VDEDDIAIKLQSIEVNSGL